MSESPPASAADLIAVEMFRTLPSAAIADLSSRATIRHFEADELVFAEGDAGDSLFVVRNGKLEVVRARYGHRVVLDTLQAGSAFGELGVLNSSPRLASVVSVEASEALEIDHNDVNAMLDAHPSAVRRMLGTVARSLTLAKEQLACHNRDLEHEVRRRTADLQESQLEVVRRLGRAAEARDDVTGHHITRMSEIAHLLAVAVGMDSEQCALLPNAAPMHDVGKLSIPDSVLLKPGPLDAKEWELMKRHTIEGAELLQGSNSPVVKLAEVIALSHHERWDGSGYPYGLAGEEIPLVGRVCAIADVFDALVSERPYKKAWTPSQALAEIGSQAGRQFDPALVDSFLSLGLALEERIASSAAREYASR